MSLYFVYELLDPRVTPAVPFYVGMSKDYGKRRYRPDEHLREARKTNLPENTNWCKVNKIRKIIADGLEPIIYITHEFNNREDCICQEIASIAKYGRINKSNGILTNLTDGGEGATGKIYTDEECRLKSLQTKGERNGMFGKQHSLDVRAKMSENRKGKGHDRIISDSQKGAICRSNSSRIVSDRVRERGREFFTGNAFNKGLKRTDETCRKISQARTGKYRDTQCHTWYHLQYGSEYCTVRDLIAKYPDQNLHACNLIRVVGEHSTNHKGWSLRDETLEQAIIARDAAIFL